MIDSFRNESDIFSTILMFYIFSVRIMNLTSEISCKYRRFCNAKRYAASQSDFEIAFRIYKIFIITNGLKAI